MTECKHTFTDWGCRSCLDKMKAAECKHEWYAKDGDTRGIYRCRVCNTTSNVTPMVDESRIREIVREEIAKAAQPCRHEKWIEMGEAFEVCRSCGTKR